MRAPVWFWLQEKQIEARHNEELLQSLKEQAAESANKVSGLNILQHVILILKWFQGGDCTTASFAFILIVADHFSLHQHTLYLSQHLSLTGDPLCICCDNKKI